jgi:hypothetical protein
MWTRDKLQAVMTLVSAPGKQSLEGMPFACSWTGRWVGGDLPGVIVFQVSLLAHRFLAPSFLLFSFSAFDFSKIVSAGEDSRCGAK